MLSALVLVYGVSITADFAVLAERAVRIGEYAVVEGGAVGAGDALTVGTRGSAATCDAQQVTLAARAQVGAVQTNDLHAATSATHGAVSAFVALPALPANPSVFAGTLDVTVSAFRTQHLAPGVYRALRVGLAGRVDLDAGAYVFSEITLAAGASLRASGATQVSVVGDVTVGLLASARADHAKDLKLLMHGTFDISAGGDVRALVLAGQMRTGLLSSAVGALFARDIALGTFAHVTFADGFSASGTCVDCNDGNPCTTDACESGTCAHHPVAAGTSCSDNNACNGVETCNPSSACLAGTSPVVDDGNPCTADTCSPASGVTHAPVATGTSCSDGNACNGAEACSAAGACSAGTPPATDDANPCTADACSPASGVTHTPVPAGTSCADANACNGSEACNGVGACLAGAAPVVDDGNPCTSDACDAVAGVFHLPLSAGVACDNATVCDGSEVCDGADHCLAEAPPTLDDHNLCTSDSCDATAGVLHTALAAGTSCADANACDGAETCNASGACVAGTAPIIDDNNPCTTDACVASSGVTHIAVAAGTTCETDANVCNGASSCDATGACAAGTAPVLDDGNDCTADTCDPTTGPAHQPIVDCIPDPALVAPPLDRTQKTTFHDMISFLYAGAQPVQLGADPAAFDPVRESVFRGRVIGTDGTPIAGVDVRVHGAPEFGYTRTRRNGAFMFAVNGGGEVTFDFSSSNFLAVQRTLHSTWRNFASSPDVVLTALDTRVTPVTFLSPQHQIARGSPVTDSAGTRTATLIVPPETSATAVLANGQRVPLSAGSIRASEYSVGPNGPRAMPGDLPPTSGYTYAVEVSIDEALSLGATTVEFDRAVPFYVDNFRNIPVGWTVPVGYYDRARASWIGIPNGRSLAVVGITGAIADLDTDGDGVADSDDTLATLGIDAAERTQLATLYAPGAKIWRVALSHLTPLDMNLPLGPPAGATPPGDNPPVSDPDANPDCHSGSVIECQNQILGESVPLVGTPMRLHYSSDRAPGYRASAALDVDINAAPGSIYVSIGIDIGRQRAGDVYLGLSRPLTVHFVWDGLDWFGRAVQGQELANVVVTNCYNLVYYPLQGLAEAWAAIGNPAIGASSGGGENEICFSKGFVTPLGHWDNSPLGFGGWSLSVHHAFDPVARTLYLGDGSRVQANGAGLVIDELTKNTLERRWQAPQVLAPLPDGTVYFASDFGTSIWKADRTGDVSLVAGDPVTRGYQDGPGTTARFAAIRALAVDASGRLFVADAFNHTIRTVDRLGNVSTVAGKPSYENNDELNFVGRSARENWIGTPVSMALRSDGTIVYANDFDQPGIFEIDTNGNIRRITAASGGSDDGNASEAYVSNPGALSVTRSGDILFCDSEPSLRRISPDGRLRTIAGGGVLQEIDDGANSRSIRLAQCSSPVETEDGTVYFVDQGTSLVWRVLSDAQLWRVAGVPASIPNFHPGAAAPARLFDFEVRSIAVMPDRSLLVGGAREVPSLFTMRIKDTWDVTATNVVASADGTEVYSFSSGGKHQKTFDAVTGVLLREFIYDSHGLLIEVRERSNLTTRMERDADGKLLAIVGPYGARNDVDIDSNGFATRVQSPAGNAYRFEYADGGLLMQKADPRNGLHHYTYDSEGRLTQDTNPGNGSSRLIRDKVVASSTTVSLATAEGRTTTYLSSEVQRIRKHIVTDPRGLTTTHVFDNGLETVTDPTGSVSTIAANADPRFGITSSTPTALELMPSGLQRSVAVKREAVLSDPNDAASLSQWKETTDISGFIWRDEYDVATRTRTRTSPLLRSVETELDDLGRVHVIRPPATQETVFNYDTFGRPSTIVSGTRSSSFTYDSLGRLATTTDALARTTQFFYDADNRLTTKVRPDGSAIAMTYDGNGNITSVTPAGKSVHALGYTANDLLEDYDPPLASGVGTKRTTYLYNLDGDLTDVLQPDGRNVHVTLDAAGRAIATATDATTIGSTFDPVTGQLRYLSSSATDALAFTYDGRLLTTVTSTGASAGVVGYSYDVQFRRVSDSVNGLDVIYNYDNDSDLLAAGDLVLGYDAARRLTDTTLANITTMRTLNEFGEVTADVARFAGVDVYGETYVRDAGGRIASRTVGGDSETFYTYDSVGRLIDVVADTMLEHYAYDDNGNRTAANVRGQTIAASYDGQDRLLHYGGATFTYGAAGDLLSRADATGTVQYTYDALGNLRSATLPSATITYTVDALNRRVAKTKNGLRTQTLLYDGARIVAELDNANNVLSRFVYGTHALTPDTMIRDGVTYRIVTDHVGSPVLIVDAQSGTPVQRMRYDSFGVVLEDTNPGFSPFGFAGGLYDRDTGLVRFGARDYDPETGRWSTKDPVRFNGGDTNLYGYAINDPINALDPSGLAIVFGQVGIGASAPDGAGSVALGIAFDTSNGEIFGYSTEGSAASAIGLFTGAGASVGIFSGGQDTFLGGGRSESIAMGWELTGAGMSRLTSGDDFGFSFDFYGPSFGFTANTQTTNTIRLFGTNTNRTTTLEENMCR